jgi:hypothetical protein
VTQARGASSSDTLAAGIYDSLSHSSCGWRCGFMIEKPTKGSPIDAVLLAASIVFPLDFVLLTFIVNAPKVFGELSRLFTFDFADTLPSAVFVSWSGVVGSTLRLYSAFCHQKTRYAASGPAFALHVFVSARICDAVANFILGASGTNSLILGVLRPPGSCSIFDI